MSDALIPPLLGAKGKPADSRLASDTASALPVQRSSVAAVLYTTDQRPFMQDLRRRS